MKPMAFINYRRSDSSQAAQGLYAQMRARFGPNHVFMDVSGITPGSEWPDRLRRALDESSVMLSVTGPRWLTASDQFGRRRLDEPDDWVRNEIIHALKCRKPIIPVRVGGAGVLPPEALPPEMRGLLNSQGVELRDEKWDLDLNELIRILATEYGFVDSQKPVLLPEPEVTIESLSEEELDAALRALPGWQPVESMIPGDYPKSRQELRKSFRFGSFAKAIGFMQAAVEPINKLQHHPRWENQWRTVTVHLSTWDIGYKISKLDIELARILEELFESLAIKNKKKADPREATGN